MKNDTQQEQNSLELISQEEMDRLTATIKRTIGSYKMAADAIMLEKNRLGIDFNSLLNLALSAINPNFSWSQAMTAFPVVGKDKFLSWHYIQKLEI